MCGKSRRADTVVVSSLIMLPGRLMDRQGRFKASGDEGFKKSTHKSKRFLLCNH